MRWDINGISSLLVNYLVGGFNSGKQLIVDGILTGYEWNINGTPMG